MVSPLWVHGVLRYIAAAYSSSWAHCLCFVINLLDLDFFPHGCKVCLTGPLVASLTISRSVADIDPTGFACGPGRHAGHRPICIAHGPSMGLPLSPPLDLPTRHAEIYPHALQRVSWEQEWEMDGPIRWVSGPWKSPSDKGDGLCRVGNNKYQRSKVPARRAGHWKMLVTLKRFASLLPVSNAHYISWQHLQSLNIVGLGETVTPGGCEPGTRRLRAQRDTYSTSIMAQGTSSSRF